MSSMTLGQVKERLARLAKFGALVDSEATISRIECCELAAAIDAHLAGMGEAVAEVIRNESGQVYLQWTNKKSIADFRGARLYTAPTERDMEKPTYILFDKRQTLGESLVSDGATFGMLLLCIWVSQGSTWWTFCTALMFLCWLGAKGAAIVWKRQHQFKGIEELQAWAEQERSNA